MNTRFKLAVAALALTTCTANAQTMGAQVTLPVADQPYAIQQVVIQQPVVIQGWVDPTAIQRKQAQLDADYEHAQDVIQRATDRSMCRFYNSYC